MQLAFPKIFEECMQYYQEKVYKILATTHMVLKKIVGANCHVGSIQCLFQISSGQRPSDGKM